MKPATTQEMTGARALALMAHGYGVSSAFFVPTFALQSLAEMDRLGIKIISAHGEKAAAYMADGYARVTGRPGLCMSQTVGAALLAAGLKDAYMVGSPVIALTGGPESSTSGRKVYQEVDDFQSFGAVTKWQGRVDRVARLPELLRQAFRAATTGSPRPVHLEVSGHLGQMLDEVSELDLSVESAYAVIPAHRPVADEASLGEAAEELLRASSPVIVAGQGVVSSGADVEIKSLAEKLDIPIVTSLNAKAILPEHHPLAVGVTGAYSRACANQTLARADVVFFIGTSANSMTTTGWQLPLPGSRIIHLDIDAEQLGRHFATTVALHGDAKASLRRLIDIVETRKNPDWIEEVQGRVAKWRAEAQLMRESHNVPIRPERICSEISAALPRDGALVVDTLQASIWAGSMVYLEDPSQQFVRCGGSLGWSLPASIGAKAALGDRAVICFTGDGGIYYHLAELETAARYGLNVIVVINNNGAYAGEKQNWDSAYGDDSSHLHWQFGRINFANIATEMGCLGIRVEDPDDISEALGRGLVSERPTVIDIASDFSAYHPKGWLPLTSDQAED